MHRLLNRDNDSRSRVVTNAGSDEHHNYGTTDGRNDKGTAEVRNNRNYNGLAELISI